MKTLMKELKILKNVHHYHENQTAVKIEIQVHLFHQ